MEYQIIVSMTSPPQTVYTDDVSCRLSFVHSFLSGLRNVLVSTRAMKNESVPKILINDTVQFFLKL